MQKSPLVTYGLLLVNVSLWLLMEANGGSTNSETLTRFGMKVNALISAGEVWRLITPMFLHIGFVHLAVNSFSLYNVGAQLESLVGPVRFSLTYFFAGVCGVLLSYLFSPNDAAGASGAIFGVIGALGVYFVVNRRWFRNTGQILTNILLIGAINLAYGFTASGIDNYGHIGGLLGGLLMGAALTPPDQIAINDWGWMRVPARLSIVRWALIGGLMLALAVGSAAAIVSQSDSADVYLARGQKLVEAEQWREAESVLNEAIARDAERAEAYFYLGIAQFQQKNFKAAAATFERELSLHANASARFNLALCYVELGRYAAAREQLENYRQMRGADRAKANDLLKQLEGR